MQRRMKRDEVVLFRILDRVKARPDEALEANRLPRELGECYGPVGGAAIVDGPSRRRPVELPGRGERDAVAAAIDGYIEAYTAQSPEPARPGRAGRPTSGPERGPRKR